MDSARYTGITVIIAVLAGFFFPHFSIFKDYLLIMLGLLVFSSVLGMSRKELVTCVQRPKHLVIILAIMYLIMPVASWFVGSRFLSPELLAGYVIAAMAPAATGSPFWTKLIKGDRCLSLAFVGVSLLAAPIFIPILSYLLLSTIITVPVISIAEILGVIILLPVAAAYLIGKVADISKYSGWIALPTVLIIVATIISLNAENLLNLEYAYTLLLLAAFQVLLAFGIGWFLTIGHTPPERKALLFSVSVRNMALAMAIALLYFGPLAALPAAFLILLHMALISFLLIKPEKSK